MGAQDFQEYSDLLDVNEAFKDAHDRACYEYGHGGYTGSMAEKGDYTIISSAPVIMEHAQELITKLMNANDPRISDKWGPAGAIAIGEPSGPVKTKKLKLRINGGVPYPQNLKEPASKSLGKAVHAVSVLSSKTKYRKVIRPTEGDGVTLYDVVRVSEMRNMAGLRVDSVERAGFESQAKARAWLDDFLKQEIEKRSQQMDGNSWFHRDLGNYGVVGRRVRSSGEPLVLANVEAVHSDIELECSYYESDIKVTHKGWLFFGWASS